MPYGYQVDPKMAQARFLKGNMKLFAQQNELIITCFGENRGQLGNAGPQMRNDCKKPKQMLIKCHMDSKSTPKRFKTVLKGNMKPFAQQNELIVICFGENWGRLGNGGPHVRSKCKRQ